MAPIHRPCPAELVAASTLATSDFHRLAWRAVALPQELTGIEARIVLFLGGAMPAGSVSTATAYGMVLEAEAGGAVEPGRTTLLAPYVGSPGPGCAWVARRCGYRHMILHAAGMEAADVESRRMFGAEWVGVAAANDRELMHKVHEHGDDPDLFVFAPASSFSAYRYHYRMTGEAILATVPGPIAGIVSSASEPALFAAADRAKETYSELLTVVVEDQPGALYGGAVRDEIPADLMVPLNLRLKGLDRVAHLDPGLVQAVAAHCWRELGWRWELGPHSIAALIAAVQVGRAEGFSGDDTIVVVGADGWSGPPPAASESTWGTVARLREIGDDGLADLTPPRVRERLMAHRERFWHGLVTKEELGRQRRRGFWRGLVAESPMD
jgi:cysteine synthase